MKTCRQFVIVLMGVVLLATAGCQKKQPQLPSQATAPAGPIPTSLPPEITEETPPPPPPAAPPQEPPPQAEEPKPQPSKHHKKKPSPPPTQSSESNAQPSGNSTVAAGRPPANPANEAPPDTAIAADVSSAQLLHQKQTTAQLLE